MTETRNAPGPQIGVPPSLEQIPVGRLQVDQTYQRATDSPASRGIIAGMVKSWDWSLCQPLVVMRRSDGSLFVLDGQHRLSGAIARGDIPFVPCVILSSLDHQGEARTFVALNTRRQKLSQGQIFHGMLAAGDPDACRVQAMLDETGWRVCQHSNTASFKPGDLECAPMLVRMLVIGREDAARFALQVLRRAYPDQAVRQSATLIKALAEVFAAERFGITKMVATLSATPCDRWLGRGAVIQEQRPGMSQISCIAHAMILDAQGKAFVAAPAPTPHVSLPKAASVSTTFTPPPERRQIRHRRQRVVHPMRTTAQPAKRRRLHPEILRAKTLAVR